MHARSFVAVLAAFALGCQSVDNPGAPQGSVFPDAASLNGTFRYQAWTSDNRPVVVGTIVLTLNPDSSITGSWDLRWAPGADTTAVVGPQIGTGTLEGGIWRGAGPGLDRYTWGANLNPGWADNNVFVGGSFGEPTAWYHSGIVGPISGGRATLERLTR